MTLRVRLLGAAAAACVLAAIVAGASAAAPSRTQSLGIHFERTGIASLLARDDGDLVALQGRRIESFQADGALEASASAVRAPAESRLFPVAGGKILVLGYQKLTRLNPDGSIDTSFGEGGTVEVDGSARAAFELGSGKIAVVSVNLIGPRVLTGALSVALLNQAGGSAGSGPTGSVAPPSGNPVPEISPLADGGALVVGHNFLLELNSDGSAKRGFGKAGLVAGDGTDGQVGAHVFADGSIETAGTGYENGAGEDFVLHRYTAAGQLDPTFGAEGQRSFDLGGEDGANVASWGADGSVIVGGITSQPGACPEEECEEAPVLAAFDAAGERETAFAQDGVLRLGALAGLPDGYRSDGVTAIARRPDGSIVAAGNAPPNETSGFLAAFSPQGALLPAFGEGGIVPVHDPLRAEQEVAGFIPRPGGGLLAVGTTDLGIEDRPVLIRYASDDGLDSSFGDGSGYVILRESRGISHGATGFAVSGDEVLTGVYDYPVSHLLMVHAGDGSPVTSFGSDGSVGLPSEIRTAALGFAGDRDPIVLGIENGPGGASTDAGVVLRYRPDGSLDRSFARRGKFTMRLADGQVVRGKALLTGPGKRILVGGSVGDRFVMVSLLPDGKPDPRFGESGWSIINVGGKTHAFTLDRVGSHVYLAGVVGDKYSDHQELVLMRFLGNGRLDRSFGGRGHLVTASDAGYHPTAIIPAADGVLVVLSGGLRPLVTFDPEGRVRKRPAGARPRYVSDVRATVAEGRIVLGWTEYDKKLGRTVYNLVRRPLPR